MKACSGCDHMFYCSENCRNRDLKIHKYECEIFKNHYELFHYPTRRLLLRLYLTLKHFPDKRFGTDSSQALNYEDLISHRDEIQKDEKKLETFENILKDFHQAGINCDREELFECFCKIISNTFTMENINTIPIGLSMFVMKSNHSCDPNADLLFNGVNIKVRALKNISSTDKITVSLVDLKNSRKTRQELLKQSRYIMCTCSKCTNDNENGKFLYIFCLISLIFCF